MLSFPTIEAFLRYLPSLLTNPLLATIGVTVHTSSRTTSYTNSLRGLRSTVLADSFANMLTNDLSAKIKAANTQMMANHNMANRRIRALTGCGVGQEDTDQVLVQLSQLRQEHQNLNQRLTAARQLYMGFAVIRIMLERKIIGFQESEQLQDTLIGPHKQALHLAN
jgi:hypothetical protein